ncbi:MAG: c-type cytochrome [Thermonemataceae bacterium]|nr:c-type cytochrome [Thermonemataceae bacterium]
MNPKILQKMKAFSKKLAMSLSFLALSFSASAQNVVVPSNSNDDMMFWILVGLIGLTTAIIVLLIVIAFQLINILQKSTAPIDKNEQVTFWEKFIGFKPKAMEQKLLLDEDFDGIKELDNPIPAWFNWFFGVTIAFAVLYMPIYHVWKVWDLQEVEYEKEVKVAEIKKEAYLKKVANSIDEKNVKAVTDAGQLKNGEAVFKANCASCHGQKAEGLIGPNLTDEYWLYGGQVTNIFKIVKYGNNKGMPAWQKQLNPLQIQQVSSYVLSLKGSNPPNAKEPQGTKEEGGAASEKAVSMK